ncbi:hypothetical protein Tco_0017919 [Tanacetum coccineum]
MKSGFLDSGEIEDKTKKKDSRSVDHGMKANIGNFDMEKSVKQKNIDVPVSVLATIDHGVKEKVTLVASKSAYNVETGVVTNSSSNIVEPVSVTFTSSVGRNEATTVGRDMMVSFATLLKGKQVAFSVVENYVKNTCSKYGLVRARGILGALFVLSTNEILQDVQLARYLVTSNVVRNTKVSVTTSNIVR